MASFVGLTFSQASSIKDSTAATIVDNAETQYEYITGVPGVSTVSTITASMSNQVCRVVVKGLADVYITIGPAPVASQGVKFMVLAGTTEYFAINKGDKVAVFEMT